MRRSRLDYRAAFLVAVATAVAWLTAGCGSATPSVTPRTPATVVASAATGSWIAARVEQPAEIEAAPTDAPVFCSPCHPVLGTYIDTLVAFNGGYLGLGLSQPPSEAAAWRSSDAMTWTRVPDLPAPQGSGISAAVVQGGAVVAVGTSGGRAAVWRTADGVAWTAAQLAAPPAGFTEQLTAIASAGSGFVAGGYEQSSSATRTATLWRSADGVTWSRPSISGSLTSAPAGEAGSTEITGIADGTSGLVAVGISGDERRGQAGAWRSPDGGASWQPVSSPSFGAGRMLAVATLGSSFVAVGENVDQTAAEAWTSADGSTWQEAPAQPGLENGGLQMVMTAVAASAANSGVVAAGWRTDAGNGSAVVWRSADGITWDRLPQDVTFSGAGLACVIASPRVLVAGTMGWPDTHAAQVWVAPKG
jgi:hypothetical protein